MGSEAGGRCFFCIEFQAAIYGFSLHSPPEANTFWKTGALSSGWGMRSSFDRYLWRLVASCAMHRSGMSFYWPR
eukprot:4426211-Pyramimonas_sp.AAC.1